jgi:TlyA family rRNA methyltransferase/putative hemolysin
MARTTLLSHLLGAGYPKSEIQSLLMAGLIKINGRTARRSDEIISDKDEVEISEPKNYPARAAYKLLGAFEDLEASEHARQTSPGKDNQSSIPLVTLVSNNDQPSMTPVSNSEQSEMPSDVNSRMCRNFSPKGKVCIDLGASHGGFTKVLLEKGAAEVYAVDVAYGIFDFNLRRDERVKVLERKNVRDINSSWFSEDSLKEDLFIVSDLSFISIKTVLNVLRDFLIKSNCKMRGLFLVKPQFESSAETENGIINDETIRLRIVDEVRLFAEAQGFHVCNIFPSKLKGQKGNQEYIMQLVFNS